VKAYLKLKLINLSDLINAFLFYIILTLLIIRFDVKNVERHFITQCKTWTQVVFRPLSQVPN